MEKSTLPQKYATYCRPKLARMMKVVRLDKVYHKAIGDHVYYMDEAGKEVDVLDFLGGFGSTMLGHNHPDLVAVAKANLDHQVPFSVQASCRSKAALLCEKLNEMLCRRTGKNYITTLANTGTECVEAALKHAELSKVNRLNALMKQLRRQETLVEQQFKEGTLKVKTGLSKMIRERMGVTKGSDFDTYLWAVRNYNHAVFRKPPVFLALTNSFHGKTSGSVQLTYHEEYRVKFDRIGFNVVFLDPGDTAGFEKAIKDATIHYLSGIVNSEGEFDLEEKKYVNISALFVEPIQGEGGINLIPASQMAYFREITSAHGFPLILDEIQCGMGRTGTFLYSEQQNVVADYYLLSKSLGGGLSKISALMVDDEVYEPDFGYIHSSTFAEDDHSAMIALKTLELLDDDALMKNCIDRGEQLISGIHAVMEDFPGVIREVRGKGLMLGMEFCSQINASSRTIHILANQGLFGYVVAGWFLNEHDIRLQPTLSNTNTIRLEPSAFITEEACDKFIAALRRLVEIVYKQNIYHLTRYIVGKERKGAVDEIIDYRKEKQVFETSRHARRVAFIGHFAIVDNMRGWDEGFSQFTDEELRQFLDTTYPVIGAHIFDCGLVKSITGEAVNLHFIAVPVDSQIIVNQMMVGDIGLIHQAMEEAVELAIDNRCQVIGFGGFSSIVTRNCQSLVTNAIGLTTGNSFTVAMGIEAIHKAAAQINIPLSESCFAAVGATGNIASVYSEIMAEEVPKIILIGKPGRDERLRQVASDIYQNAFMDILDDKAHQPDKKPDNGDFGNSGLKGIAKAICCTQAVRNLLETYTRVENIGAFLYDHLTEELKDRVPVIITTDLAYLKQANLIVASSNTAEPIIFPDMLNNSPVVINDIAVPQDVDDSVNKECENVLVIQGGIVNLPRNDNVLFGGPPVAPGQSFACMAETMLLGLTGISEHFSVGRITRQQVKKIKEIGKMHGFSLAGFKTNKEKSY